MTDSIIKYIQHLNNHYGFSVTLHGSGLTPYLDKLVQFNAHECAYCMYVKSSAECWKRCREGQHRAEKRSSEGAFFGSCYAGVGEFVFPIVSRQKTVGIVSVGAYLGSPEKRASFARKYGFSEQKLSAVAQNALEGDVPPFEYVKTLIVPLCTMITVLLESIPEYSEGEGNLYGMILSIIHTGYMRKLTISDIAEKCHYSTSFISRFFKAKSGVTVFEYLKRIRMEKAAELMKNSEMSIEDVGSAVGFSDTNYFISFFSDYYGMPPRRYRRFVNAKKAED